MLQVMKCLGSDGRIYKQLLKAIDDLRQDAVMQQVFGVINHLLRASRTARRRNLQLRTYAVRYGALTISHPLRSNQLLHT